MDSSLVITVDGLNPRFLGAYGNSWIPTPAIDRMAAEGTLFENFLVNGKDPAKNLTAMVSGIHPLLAPQANPTNSISHEEKSPKRILVTDDSNIESCLQGNFDQTILCKFALADGESGQEPEDTAWDNLFQTAFQATVEAIQSTGSNSSLQIWVHTKGFYGDWESPLDYQKLFKDESDPEPILVKEAPSRLLQEDFDPDEKLAYVHAYAAMLVRLDECLDGFISAVHDLPTEFFIALAGVRGFPLGEHLEIGEATESLYMENLKVPLIGSNSAKLPRRVRDLVEAKDFPKLLADLADRHPLETTKSPSNKLVVSTSKQFARIQSAAWSYACTLPDSPANDVIPEKDYLFSQPSDPMEANEVSDVCPDITQILNEELQRQLKSYSNGETPTDAELDSTIFDGLA